MGNHQHGKAEYRKESKRALQLIMVPDFDFFESEKISPSVKHTPTVPMASEETYRKLRENCARDEEP